MKGLTFLILITILSLSQGALANDALDTAPDRVITEDELARITDNILDPTSKIALHDFAPYHNLISALQFQTDQSTQITRVLKLATEHLKKSYQNDKDFQTRGWILSALKDLAREGKLYVSKKNENTLLKNYFSELSEYVAAEDIQRDQENKIRQINEPILIRLKGEQERERLHRIAVENNYQNYALQLRNASQQNLDVALKMKIDEAEALKRTYLNTGDELLTMAEKGTFGLRYFAENNHEFGVRYFRRYRANVEKIKKANHVRRLEDQRIADIKEAAAKEQDKADADFNENRPKIISFVQGAGHTISAEELPLKILDNEIRVTTKEIGIEKTSGNVAYMVDRSKRRFIFSVEIVSSADPLNAQKAVTFVIETLLNYNQAVYLENQTRIPTGLDKSKYQTSSLGKGRVLLRPKTMCQGYFT